MKAKCVYENLDFKRGNPESTIGLGMIGQFEKGMKALNNLPHRAPIRLVNVSNFAWIVYDVQSEIEEGKINIEDLGIIFPCQFSNYGHHITESDLERVILDNNAFGTLTSMFYEGKAYRLNAIFFNNYFLIPIKKEYRIPLESLADEKYNRVSESQNFERGQDPKDAMGIGNKDARVIQSIQKMADEFGFKRVDIPMGYDQQIWKGDLRTAALWKLSGKKGNILNLKSEVALVHNTDQSQGNEYQVIGFDPDGEEIGQKYDLEYWRVPDGWRDARFGVIKESLDFERGQDPKTSMRIGKYREFKGYSAPDVASIIIKELEKYLEPFFHELDTVVERKGYRNIDEYEESIWDEENFEPLDDKKDADIELTIREMFDKAEEFVKGKYPVRKPYREKKYLEPAESIASTVVDALLNGAPHGTMIDQIARELDVSLFESLDFERGQDPKKAIGVGMEERIRQGINKDWYPHRKGVDSWNGDYNTALTWAAETGKIDIVKWLLEAGADPTHEDSQALKQAATFGQDEAVEILINAGADPWAGNGYAIMSARFAGYHELSDRIKELAARDEEGRPWQPSLKEYLDFEKGKDPKAAIGIGFFKDKNGKLIQKGAEVYVEGDSEEDDFSDFEGTVDSFHGEYVTVVDMDDDYFDIEPYKLEVLSESMDFERGQDPKSALDVGLRSKFTTLADRFESVGWRFPAGVAIKNILNISPEDIFEIKQFQSGQVNRAKTDSILREFHNDESSFKNIRSQKVAGISLKYSESPNGKMVVYYDSWVYSIWGDIKALSWYLKTNKGIDNI